MIEKTADLNVKISRVSSGDAMMCHCLITTKPLKTLVSSKFPLPLLETHSEIIKVVLYKK